MKKQPKAVYIIENGGYTELTYEEFCRREQICPLYADKLFLPLYGRLVLRGRNSSYDSLISSYNFKDYSFSKLRERYYEWNSSSMEEKILNRLVLSTVMEN